MSASRRRKIFMVSFQFVLSMTAVAVISAVIPGWATICMLGWFIVDFLSGGSKPDSVGIRGWRVSLGSALIVTGIVACVGAFTPYSATAGFGTQVEYAAWGPADEVIFLVILWSAAVLAGAFRSALPLLFPKRVLRVVASTARALEIRTVSSAPRTCHGRSVGELVCGTQFRANAEMFVEIAVGEAKRRDAELVELTFLPEAETVRRLEWELRQRDVELFLPLVGLGLDPRRIRALSQTRSSGILIAPSRPGLRVRVIKRLFDLAAASALIVLLAPVFAAVAVAIKVNMPGPVLYRQERIGQDGRPFRICKFRSMVVGADSQLEQLLRHQGTGGQPLFKVDDDPRITRLGKILRNTSLDELPQLFNVVRGRMSLVGPRPQRAGEVALYQGSDEHRLGVRPGMTGLWQVSGRSDLEWSEAREFDLYYAHNWNLRFDLGILIRTVGVVLRGAGAR